ncbi:hypothetical protein DFH08DRAFT_809611 [Mycena albidolilacea]|uniref:Secreted protein n=1 Tax=Mycena albidolilacea TaxID=1033008 RepID=A0AAD7A040_9AGAR|nr:hypothetical protein DFH08DRAFT_809611 [Mycena albidolilacea]
MPLLSCMFLCCLVVLAVFVLVCRRGNKKRIVVATDSPSESDGVCATAKKLDGAWLYQLIYLLQQDDVSFAGEVAVCSLMQSYDYEERAQHPPVIRLESDRRAETGEKHTRVVSDGQSNIRGHPVTR